MQIKRIIRAVPLAGVAFLLMAAGARADSIGTSANVPTIYYYTNGPGTAYVAGGSGLTLNPTSTKGGAVATLVFTGNGITGTGTPSAVDLGNFNLTCSNCSTQVAGTASATFGNFTFDLVVDYCGGSPTCASVLATGEFIGTGTGGTVFSDSSTISVAWSTSPVGGDVMGPGTLNALTGDFGEVIFSKQQPLTSIVAQNSNGGVTTVQGFVQSSVPEPGTTALIGCGLLGLGLLGRRRLLRD